MQFWYHMYGYNVGKLNVLRYSNGSRSSPLYSLYGNQGTTWKIAHVTIASRLNHQVSRFPPHSFDMFKEFIAFYHKFVPYHSTRTLKENDFVILKNYKLMIWSYVSCFLMLYYGKLLLCRNRGNFIFGG